MALGFAREHCQRLSKCDDGRFSAAVTPQPLALIFQIFANYRRFCRHPLIIAVNARRNGAPIRASPHAGNRLRLGIAAVPVETHSTQGRGQSSPC